MCTLPLIPTLTLTQYLISQTLYRNAKLWTSFSKLQTSPSPQSQESDQHLYNRGDPTAWLTISIFPISGSALNIGNVWLGKCLQIFCTDYSITDLWHFTKILKTAKHLPLPFCHFYGNQFNISKVCLFRLYFHCAISFNNRGSFYLLRKKRKVGT